MRTDVTMRATYGCCEWDDEPDTEPAQWGGFTDPRNPWGGFHADPPEGLCGPEFTVWRDENVDSLRFEDLREAVRFVVDFPGGVWDLSESEYSTGYRTGIETEVTLHVDGPDRARVLALAERGLYRASGIAR